MNQNMISVRRSMIVLVVIAIAIRIAWTFLITPGNAPDENAHMGMVVALTHGHLLTLDQGLAETGYPYALYNPLPYVPSAILLKAYNSVAGHAPTSLHSFLYEHCFVARLAQLFWSVPYIFLAILLCRRLQGVMSPIGISLLLLTPQIIFVQSYVNLDAMGLTATLYIAWATLNFRFKHLFAACILLSCAKMNFYAAYVFPAIYGLSLIRTNPKKCFQFYGTIVIGSIPGLLWFVYNKLTNLNGYDSLLGFSALVKIYHITPSKSMVFKWAFLSTSINSTFSALGWMNMWLPNVFYIIWTYAIIIPLSNLLIWSTFQNFSWTKLAAIMTILASMALHYYASYTNAYQPQGRYILPALILLVCFALHELPIEKPWAISIKYNAGVPIIYFILIALIFSSLSSYENPFKMGKYTFHQRGQPSEAPKIILDINSDHNEITGALMATSPIRQTFTSSLNNMSSLEILFSTFIRQNQGTVTIALSDDAGNEIFKRDYLASKLEDNQYLEIKFTPQVESKGRHYNLNISSTSTDPAASVTLWATNKDNYKEGELYISNIPTNKDLIFRVFSQASDK